MDAVEAVPNIKFDRISKQSAEDTATNPLAYIFPPDTTATAKLLVLGSVREEEEADIIKLLFWPLSHKSYKSMEQMKKLQPMMAKIREKYADDREKMNSEIMQLYKTYKVNPAGGCVPMLLQIPVFFALYQALLGAIELRHAAFITHLPFTDMIWLADLSAKDPYYITPLVMGATMFLQQRMSPPMGDPMQAKIMMFMPVVFTFLFLNFPSGLVVYWLVNNVLSIAQQWLMIRKSK